MLPVRQFALTRPEKWSLQFFEKHDNIIYIDIGQIYMLAPPRDLLFQNVLVPHQGDMMIRLALLLSAYVHIYMQILPKSCTFNPVDLTCIDVTS